MVIGWAWSTVQLGVEVGTLSLTVQRIIGSRSANGSSPVCNSSYSLFAVGNGNVHILTGTTQTCQELH